MKSSLGFRKQKLQAVRLALVLSLCFFNASINAQSSDETAVRQLLQDQTAAWNKGDIEAFMKGYWHSDNLIFVGKNGAKYGYATTLENYKKGYPDTVTMGKLAFELIQVKKLSSKYFYVIGKWHLQRSIGDIGGSFTLLLQKIKGEWFIISDHSS